MNSNPSLPKNKKEIYGYGFNLMKGFKKTKTNNETSFPLYLSICISLDGREGGTIANYCIYQTKIYDTNITKPGLNLGPMILHQR